MVLVLLIYWLLGIVLHCLTLCFSTWDPECWHFDNDETSKIDDVLTEHGGLLYVLPLAVHLRFLCWTSRWDHTEPFLLLEFFCGTPPSILKVIGWGGGPWDFSVSPRRLGFGFLGLGLRGLGLRGSGPELANINPILWLVRIIGFIFLIGMKPLKLT